MNGWCENRCDLSKLKYISNKNEIKLESFEMILKKISHMLNSKKEK